MQISAAQISDDALLEQVDEQVSVAVPSSMESLTHLVSADNSGTATCQGASTLCKPTSLRSGRTPRWLTILLLLALGSGAALCQESVPPPNGPADGMGPPPMEGRRPPMERAFHLGPRGRWWNNPDFVQKLSLTPDQQKKMEAVFEQSRPSLMDLSRRGAQRRDGDGAPAFR